MQQEHHGLGMGMGLMGASDSVGGPMLRSIEEIASSEHHRQLKAEIASHPLCEQLLAAHIGCLRVATPIDHLPLIDAQLAQSHYLIRSYQSQHHQMLFPPHEKQELDGFLTQYLLVLCSFKEQLQQHVRVHAVEAVMACREIEQSFQALTGQVVGGEGSAIDSFIVRRGYYLKLR
ncbi:Homeobox protein knotted-1-like 3 [Asimina triloba]